jgi:hypothetical protein
MSERDEKGTGERDAEATGQRDAEGTGERDQQGEAGDAAGGGKPSRGYRIPGRHLAGGSYGANEKEQTDDRTLKNEAFRMDDGRIIGDAGQTHPRDES